MPSRIRVLVAGTENGTLTGRSAMDWLQNHYTQIATREALPLPTRSTPRWRWLYNLRRAWGAPPNTQVRFWRERRGLQRPASGYLETLRSYGVVRVPLVGRQVVAPLYGVYQRHWRWLTDFRGLSDVDRSRLYSAALRGDEITTLTTGMVRVRDYIFRIAPWNGTLAARPSTRATIGDILPRQPNSRFIPATRAPRIGIWR